MYTSLGHCLLTHRSDRYHALNLCTTTNWTRCFPQPHLSDDKHWLSFVKACSDIFTSNQERTVHHNVLFSLLGKFCWWALNLAGLRRHDHKHFLFWTWQCVFNNLLNPSSKLCVLFYHCLWCLHGLLGTPGFLKISENRQKTNKTLINPWHL